MMNKIAHGFMEVANTDDGKTIIYTVMFEEDLSSIDCWYWKEKLLCKEIDFFVTDEDNGVVRWRGQEV